MPRRKRFKEFEMPAWITEESTQEERELVPVPVRREEVKPWYLHSQEVTQRVEDQAWYDKLVNQLAAHLSDMIYLQGPRANIDQLINNWLESHKDLYRAVLINLLTEEDIRRTLLSKNIDNSIVNSVVRLIFS